MSFSCGPHGWRHLVSPCPSCITSTNASNGIIGPQIFTGTHHAQNQDLIRISDINSTVYMGCLDKLAEFFNGDYRKASLWMITNNPHLGNISPSSLFFFDRGHKVESFITTSLDGNKAD